MKIINKMNTIICYKNLNKLEELDKQNRMYYYN